MSNIILVGPAYPYRGGIAQSEAILFQYLSTKHDVAIVNFKRQYPDLLFPGKSQFEDGEDVFGIPKAKNLRLIDTINPLSWINTSRRIAKMKPDLVIFSYWMPFFAPCFAVISFFIKLFSKTRIIFICHNILPHEAQPGQNLLTKVVFANADAFMVLSDSVEEDLKKFNQVKPFRNSPHPIYNSFGEPVLKTDARLALKRLYNVDLDNEKVILFFGFIRKYKGLQYLLEAMPEVLKHERLKLLVVGEYYDDEKPYDDQINKLGISVDVIQVSKYVPSEHIRYFFCASDLVVQPYVSATQSGISQIAYFYNKPMISTDVGALSEVVIDGKTGFIVPAEDSTSLAKAIVRFYQEDLEEAFAKNIDQEKEKYSWEYFTGKLEELF
ncbi:glycosyltransferase [Solitalea koreensis]|uniref:Glycosyltransferase involved in cell wall bisynthesis n=1 Tax=Solitalea koreensis TaxID=543615 RepID=A0A521BJS1_9SPHI|nr:glycosyltransferase [Solitalea koreensis]SMO47408.1 Glycosyltransferase involved in cell wall bisynthesis [Solitalea koreensis]